MRKNSSPKKIINKSELLERTENELKRLLKEKQKRYADQTYQQPKARDNFSPSRKRSTKSPMKVKQIKKVTKQVVNRLYYGAL